MTDATDRRDFLQRCAGLVTGLALSQAGCSKREQPDKPATARAPSKRPGNPKMPAASTGPTILGTLIGAGRFDDPKTAARTNYVALLDLDEPRQVGDNGVRRVTTDFFGHGVTPRPDKPWLAVVFEKKGPGCCEIDLRTGKVTRQIQTLRSRHFYGHGEFSADGKVLYCTEAVIKDASYRGVIAVRDSANYQLLGTFPSYGHAPHDVHLVDDGSALVVTNGGGTTSSGHAPCVAWIDVATQQLRTKLRFDSPMVNAGHIAPGDDNLAVVVSAPREGMERSSSTFVGGVSFRAGSSLHTSRHKLSKQLRGEVLSVALDPRTGIAATTCPEGGQLMFWDAATGALLAARALRGARGVSLTQDGAWFAVTHGAKAQLTMFGTRTLAPHGPTRSCWMSGSHTLNYDLRAALRS